MPTLADLPSEVILEIFAVAASSSKRTALTLSLVSSWTKSCTAPHLYATVILRSARQVAAFLALVTSHSSPGPKCNVSPASLVRNLCVTHHAPPRGSADPYAVLFNACRNVRTAALQSTFLHSSLVPAHAVHKLRCEELLVLGPTFPSDWETHAGAVAASASSNAAADRKDGGGAMEEQATTSVLEHTTHLRLLESLSSPQYSGPHLTRLPRLTHIALLIREQVYSPNPFTELDPLLASPKLHMVVVSFDFRTWVDKARRLDDWAELARRSDERLYVVERDDGDPLGQWADAVSGGESIWSKALREQEERDVRRMGYMQ